MCTNLAATDTYFFAVNVSIVVVLHVYVLSSNLFVTKQKIVIEKV